MNTTYFLRASCVLSSHSTKFDTNNLRIRLHDHLLLPGNLFRLELAVERIVALHVWEAGIYSDYKCNSTFRIGN